MGVTGILALVLWLLILPVTHAQQQIERTWKFRAGEEIVVPAGEVLRDDLYAAGNRVRIEGRIEGDLFAAAEEVVVTGSVRGDVFAAANRVTIGGPVEGDLRATAATLTISSSVGEDVLAAVGNLMVLPSARVGQDLVFASGETRLLGSVAGDLLGRTGSYTKQGTVAGRETVTIEERPAEAPAPTLLDRLFDALRRYLAILLFGGLLLWLVPRPTRLAAAIVRERPLPSLAFGLLAVVGWLAILLVLLIVALILAIPLGILGFGGLVATAVFGALLTAGLLSFAVGLASTYLASVIVGLAIGLLLLARGMAGEAERPWTALLLGVLIVVLLTSIPVVGGLLSAIVALLGLGALVLLARRSWQAQSLAAPGQEFTPGGAR
jgi:hypothetical protein